MYEETEEQRLKHLKEVNRLKTIAILCFIGAAICLVLGVS